MQLQVHVPEEFTSSELSHHCVCVEDLHTPQSQVYNLLVFYEAIKIKRSN